MVEQAELLLYPGRVLPQCPNPEEFQMRPTFTRAAVAVLAVEVQMLVTVVVMEVMVLEQMLELDKELLLKNLEKQVVLFTLAAVVVVDLIMVVLLVVLAAAVTAAVQHTVVRHITEQQEQVI